MIGLEVHVYLKTRSKLFCACSADALAASAPNTQICPICSGQPGSKPMAPNEAALTQTLRIARALGARASPTFRFLRKHYFYPDQPSNYQRTGEPLATGGALEGARLRDLHVEEDPGAFDPATGLVDYNRAGAPLVEIVTEPDFESPAHARRFLDELRVALRYLDAARDDAGLKADCNVSTEGGERVEIKNVNSVRNVERALAGEVERQLALRARGEAISRETRGFDEATGRSTRLREKESESDYRYMIDPDLLGVDVAAIGRLTQSEESPFVRRARIATALSLQPSDVSPLLEDKRLVDAYEQVAARAGERLAFDWFVRDLRADLDYAKTSIADSKLEPRELADLLEAVRDNKVTPKAARRVQRDAIAGAQLLTLLRNELGVTTGDDALAQAARDAVAHNPRAVADYRAGKTTAVNFLVGAVMRQVQGRSRPDDVKRAVEQALAEVA